jgi:crotonobetaine/carnitine-CoA ligase
VTWAPATFAARWRQAVAAHGDGTFLVWEGPDGVVTTWTYAELDALVARVARGLTARGLAPGRAVHLALTNSPAFVATWLAVTQLGGWIVPSDPKATAPELAGHLARTRPAVGVCSVERSAAYREAVVAAGAAGAAGDVEVEVVEVAEDDTVLEPLTGAGAGAGAPLAWGDVSPPGLRDRAAVMFTSGTTSAPKGVVVTQANYAFAGDVMAAAAALTAADRQLVVLPLFHANAQYYSVASAISAGASVALMPTFSASGFLAQAARHGATHASLFAAPVRMILARGATPVAGLRLRHCWYAQNVTDQQYEAVAGLLGCRPRQLYGMTETIPAVLTNRAVGPVPSSMGEVTLGCAVDLRSPEDGAPVAPGGEGEVGEVVVAGEPGLTQFDGYLDDPATTAASFRDGWFRTGDLATVDAQGRYTFAGRRSDVLKVAGENVSVVEIESVIAEDPSVLEVAVVGEPDPIRDEVPVAFVVQAPGAAPIDVDGLAALCAGRLAKAKRPRRFEIVAELPRTSVGKIRKFLLQR